MTGHGRCEIPCIMGFWTAPTPTFFYDAAFRLAFAAFLESHPVTVPFRLHRIRRSSQCLRIGPTGTVCGDARIACEIQCPNGTCPRRTYCNAWEFPKHRIADRHPDLEIAGEKKREGQKVAHKLNRDVMNSHRKPSSFCREAVTLLVAVARLANRQRKLQTGWRTGCVSCRVSLSQPGSLRSRFAGFCEPHLLDHDGLSVGGRPVRC